MPYDLPFSRIIKVDNTSALELNKSLATKLILAYPEVYDLNHASSGSHFSKQEIAFLDDEFPEKHFSLYADIGEMGFSFQFWKDTVWLELGASGNPYVRFTYVRNYAVFLEQQGFIIRTPPEAKATTLDERIAWHLQEYKGWVGFVEYVRSTVTNEPPSYIE